MFSMYLGLFGVIKLVLPPGLQYEAMQRKSVDESIRSRQPECSCAGSARELDLSRLLRPQVTEPKQSRRTRSVFSRHARASSDFNRCLLETRQNGHFYFYFFPSTQAPCRRRTNGCRTPGCQTGGFSEKSISE